MHMLSTEVQFVCEKYIQYTFAHMCNDFPCACICLYSAADGFTKVPVTPPGRCTTICFTDDDRDTSVFTDVGVYACNCAVRNERARTRVIDFGDKVAAEFMQHYGEGPAVCPSLKAIEEVIARLDKVHKWLDQQITSWHNSSPTD